MNLDVRLFCFIEIYKPLIEYEALEKEGGGEEKPFPKGFSSPQANERMEL